MSKISNARNFRSVNPTNAEQAALRCAWNSLSAGIFKVSFE